MKAFITWLKHSFVRFLDGLQTIGEKSPSRLCENCLPVTLEKSLSPPPTASKKKQASAKKFSGAKADFQKLLDDAGVRYFDANEVFFRGARDAKLQLNTDPPRALWPSLLAVVRVADEARHRLGRPLRINSAYRSPAYNRSLPGAARNSIHTQGGALDLAGSPATLHKILTQLRAEGFFKGGIGKYRTFVHVDVRGRNADWAG